jgi:hypothetical protein
MCQPMSGRNASRLRPAIPSDVPRQDDPLQRLYDAIHNPRGRMGDPASHKPPTPSEGIDWNQSGHTIDMRHARMFKGRLESRDHRKERRAREWKTGEHGPWQHCPICGEYKKWGLQHHGSSVCPECLPEVGEAAFQITRAFMVFAGTWPVLSPLRRGVVVVYGMMTMAGSLPREP